MQKVEGSHEPNDVLFATEKKKNLTEILVLGFEIVANVIFFASIGFAMNIYFRLNPPW